MLARLTAGLAVLFTTLSIGTASAAAIEAVWNVQLFGTQFNYANNTSERLTVPAQFQVRTSFLARADATFDWGFTTDTEFGIGQNASITSPLTSRTVPNPFSSPSYSGSMIIGNQTDAPGAFYESLNLVHYEMAEDSQKSWSRNFTIDLTRATSARNGNGTADAAFTADSLFDFLLGVQSGIGEIQANFNQLSTLQEYDSATSAWKYVAGIEWRGIAQLVSVRRVDVPEPSAIALVGIGLLSAAFLRRKRA